MSIPIALSEINQLETDFTAVSVVAALIDENKIETDCINIVPVGADRNAYAKEIKRIHQYYSDALRLDKVTIEINKEGFYDMLPEGLFHSSPKFLERTSKERMISDVRKWREEEYHARQFFRPFESEIYHMRTIMHRYENRVDQKLDYNEYARLLTPLWPELNLLSADQCVVWTHLIPLIPYRRNNLKFLESMVESLFHITCHTSRQVNKPVSYAIPVQQQFVLGGGKLGVDTVIGHQIAMYVDVVTVKLLNLDQNSIALFLPDGINYKIMKKLCSYLLPLAAQITIIPVGIPKDRLGTESRDAPLLGYNTKLSNK